MNFAPLVLLIMAPVSQLLAQTAASVPVTGPPSPGMEAYDRLLAGLMQRYRIPGGAVAVSRYGRLVLAHGYGWSDQEARQPVEPDSLFRIASISKPFTAAAVLNLAQAGRLHLDTRVLDLLPGFAPPDGDQMDPMWRQVTVRELLWHAGGWDRDRSGDPMFEPARIAGDVRVPCPPGAGSILRWMLGQPFDFQPGRGFAYSNFGYSVLGRVIESVSGQPYETYVRENVLWPAGISRMRLGASARGGRARGEVRYYDYPGAGRTASVFPGHGAVPAPYGSFNLEAMDAHGGWIASPIDLVRFANALDGRSGAALLPASALRTMLARPPEPVAGATAASYYGMGWNVRPLPGGDAHWWHDGSLPGTATLLVRAGNNGMCWAALFNMRPEDAGAFAAELDRTLWEALGQTSSFPAHDLFGQFPSAT